ncbi:MAG: serine O-acetyltransferase [Candidatus Eremiobacteraeota bacterium]|nr:serine O-acetyltransferase [Candidatus Eremiobacteraeota bacterium]
MIEDVLADLRAPLERDPAANGWLEVVFAYPGFHALVAHRFVHWLHRRKIPVVPRVLGAVARFYTGIEIDPGAVIGRGVFIDHGMGVVIGATAEVGDGCTIYQGVTLGGTSLARTKRHPTLGRDVTVGSGASVLGAITVGDGARIGANSVVVKDVPPNATVVGIPGRVVLQDGKPIVTPADPRPRVDMPDPNAQLIQQLNERIAALEARLAELERKNAPSSV